MVKKKGALPHDLSQDEKKSILKRAKSLLFRGPPHRSAPSSQKNGQEPDLEGQDDRIPARPKMEGKDIVATTSFSSRFTFPPIPTPPGSPKRLPKATRACPGQAAGAIPKRKSKVYSMLATECENTSSETEPELSSEDDAPQQEENSVWATKVLGAPWNRIGKECPELPTESKNSPGALSQSSFQWAQGDGPLPQEDSTACLIQGVSVLLWKRTNKVGLAPPTESETTPRDLCKLSFSCGQGKSPPPRQVSPAGTLKEVRAPRRGDNKISPARPKDPMVSSSVLLEPSFNWAQGEGHSSQETSPVWGIQGVSVLKKCKIGPLSLATESKTAPRAPSEASCSWAQGQCQPPQEAGPAFISRPCRLWRKMSKKSSAQPTESKTAPRLPPEPSCSWAQGQCQPPQEAGPAFISRPCRLWRKMSKATSALPTEPKTAPRLPPEPSCSWAQGQCQPPKEAGPAFISRPCRLWRKMSKASSALPTDSKTAPRLPLEASCSWAQGQCHPAPQEPCPASTSKAQSLCKKAGKLTLTSQANPSPTTEPKHSREHKSQFWSFLKYFRPARN